MSFPVIKQMPKMTRRVVGRVNLGLYLDRSNLVIPEGGMSACNNVRIHEGRVRADNMGWAKFFATQLTGQVLMIDQFLTRSGTRTLIMATPKDLYRYDDGTSLPLFITPIYDTGTVTIVGVSTTVEGTGVDWVAAGIKAGDYICFGSADNHDPTDVWLEIDSVTDLDTLELVSVIGIPGWTGADYTIRKTFTGDEWDIWDADVFPYSQDDSNEDIWYATNNNEMVKWDGNTGEVEIYDPGFVARWLRYHKNIMLYGHITEDGEIRSGSVQNSAIGHPENVATDEASEWVATDGVDPILDMVPLGDTIVIYCERSVNVAQFVGYPIVYAVRTAVPDTGVLSSRSVVSLGDFHEFVGNDHGYRFDGVTLDEMGRHVMREVIRTVDPSRREKLISYRDRENGEIQYVIPKVTDAEDLTVTHRAPEVAYTSHYLEAIGSRDPHPFTMRDLPATAMGSYLRGDTLRFDDPEMDVPFNSVDFSWNDRFFESLFPFVLFGDGNGYVYTLGTSSAQDGVAISSYARFPRFPVADGFRRGVVKRIEPFAGKRAGASYLLRVMLWVADQAEGDLSLASEDDYDITQDGTRYVSPRNMGRYAEIEFASLTDTQGWDLSGYAVYTVPGGER